MLLHLPSFVAVQPPQLYESPSAPATPREEVGGFVVIDDFVWWPTRSYGAKDALLDFRILHGIEDSAHTLHPIDENGVWFRKGRQVRLRRDLYRRVLENSTRSAQQLLVPPGFDSGNESSSLPPKPSATAAVQAAAPKPKPTAWRKAAPPKKKGDQEADAKADYPSGDDESDAQPRPPAARHSRRAVRRCSAPACTSSAPQA